MPPRQVFRYDPPERFVAGTVGEPGQRTFFLQARGSGQLTTVVLEKEQVAVLARRMEDLLDRLAAGQVSPPSGGPAGTEDLDPLESPITEEFRVGTLTLAWDPDDERIVVEAFAMSEEEGAEEDPSDPDDPTEDDERDVLLVLMPAAQARAFARRALSLVSAGRPACPLCSQPLDPAGHICPRQNGYRRRG